MNTNTEKNVLVDHSQNPYQNCPIRVRTIPGRVINIKVAPRQGESMMAMARGRYIAMSRKNTALQSPITPIGERLQSPLVQLCHHLMTSK